MHQGGSSQKYYMPTTMDKGIVSLRKWLGSLAGPIPWGTSATPDIWAKQYTRDDILSRYNQHTQHCKHCSKVCACLCLSVYLSVCLPVCLLFAAHAYLSHCLSVCPVILGTMPYRTRSLLCLVPCACKVQHARLQMRCRVMTCGGKKSA
jgi:hypothetical protein